MFKLSRQVEKGWRKLRGFKETRTGGQDAAGSFSRALRGKSIGEKRIFAHTREGRKREAKLMNLFLGSTSL